MARADLTTLSGAFPMTERLPHPAWDAIRPWVEAQERVSPRSAGWAAVLDAWLGKLQQALGPRYRIPHFGPFHLVSAQSKCGIS